MRCRCGKCGSLETEYTGRDYPYTTSDGWDTILHPIWRCRTCGAEDWKWKADYSDEEQLRAKNKALVESWKHDQRLLQLKEDVFKVLMILQDEGVIGVQTAWYKVDLSKLVQTVEEVVE